MVLIAVRHKEKFDVSQRDLQVTPAAACPLDVCTASRNALKLKIAEISLDKSLILIISNYLMQPSYDMKNYGANALQDLHCSLHHGKGESNIFLNHSLKMLNS